MESFISLTVEELTVLLSTADFPEEARTLIQERLNTEDVRIFEAVFQAAVNQLRVKKIWNLEKERQGVNPIDAKVMDFIMMLATSEFMIRATNQKKNNTLVLHYLSLDSWLYQHIEDGVIHEFAFVEKKEIPTLLNEFYSVDFAENSESESFRLTDEQFDSLKNPENELTIRNQMPSSSGETQAFTHFMKALSQNDYNLDNISVFSIDKERQLYLENLVFFCHTDGETWLASYDNSHEKSVSIKKVRREAWKDNIEGILDFSYDLLYNRN